MRSRKFNDLFQLIYLLALCSVGLSDCTEMERDEGHSPLDLHRGGRGAPNQFLRRRGRGGEGDGNFRALGGWENGAVRDLGQI